MTRQLLIVDNDDQSEAIDKINKLAKAGAIDINCQQLLVGLPDGNDVIGDNGRIDISKVKAKFEREYGSRRFHLIVFDFKLNDPDGAVDGIELIRQFNALPKTTKAKKMLYSSELDEIVGQYLEEYKDEKSNFESSWLKFKTLINLDIVDFCKRDDYEGKVIEFIKKATESGEDYLLAALRANNDLKFNPAIEVFKGLTLDQIADKLELGHSLSENFKKQLIELAIAKFAILEK